MKATLLSLLVIICVGCTTSRSPVATVHPAGNRGYEVALHSSSFGLGGPCTFPFDPAVYDQHFYLFTGRIRGVVPAEQLQLFYARPTEDPRQMPQSALLGQITFSSTANALDIRLFVPRYNGDTVTKHVEFEMNGHYSIQRVP